MIHSSVHLLTLLLLAQAQAHMPVFDDNLYEKDVTDKSWGVYTHLEKGESFKMYLNVAEGDNVSFSVNMAGSQTFKPGTKYVNVSLSGHYAKDIQCDPHFTGWRRLLEDSTQDIEVETSDKPLVFEAFGVGYYRPLASCQGKADVGDRFWVDIHALEDITLSIGAGMAEQFTVLEILTMPVTILLTWIWDNYVITWSITTAVFLILFIVDVYCAPKCKCNLYDDLPNSVVIFGFTLNITHYAVRFVYIHLDAYSESEREGDVWLGVSLHIFAPIVVLVLALWLNRIAFDPKKPILCNVVTYGELILLAYTSALLWQGFFILPLYYLTKIAAKFTVAEDFLLNLCNSFRYKQIRDTTKGPLTT